MMAFIIGCIVGLVVGLVWGVAIKTNKVIEKLPKERLLEEVRKRNEA